MKVFCYSWIILLYIHTHYAFFFHIDKLLERDAKLSEFWWHPTYSRYGRLCQVVVTTAAPLCWNSEQTLGCQVIRYTHTTDNTAFIVSRASRRVACLCNQHRYCYGWVLPVNLQARPRPHFLICFSPLSDVFRYDFFSGKNFWLSSCKLKVVNLFIIIHAIRGSYHRLLMYPIIFDHERFVNAKSGHKICLVSINTFTLGIRPLL